MKLANIKDAKSWFDVLQTGGKSQIAVMRLEPGKASGRSPEAHEKSEQTLLVLEGEVEGVIAGEKHLLRKGDAILIPTGVKHRFVNRSEKAAVTFNVYSPPEY